MTVSERGRCRPEFEVLSAWLDVATKGLSDRSKARVREEISAHFHDAVEQDKLTGVSEGVAAKHAIESLGSPKAARRALRRTYLTRHQESMLRQYGEPSWFVSIGFGFLSMVLIWQTVIISPRWTEPGWRLRIIAAIGMVLALSILALINPRIYRRGAHRTAFVTGASANFLWWSCVAIAITGRFVAVLWLFALVPLVIRFYAPLVRKLHNPPPQLG